MKLFLTWQGVNRSGNYVAGSHSGIASELVKAKFKARWRELQVFDCEDVVGSIYVHPDSGRRVWFADIDAKPSA